MIVGLEELDKLNLRNDQYVIIGSAATIAHGRNTTNVDLDVLLIGVKRKSECDFLDIGNGKFECLSKSDIMYDSVVIDGYRYMGLKSLYLFYKELYNKTKTFKHATTLIWIKYQLIRKYLTSAQHIDIWINGELTIEIVILYVFFKLIINKNNDYIKIHNVRICEHKPKSHYKVIPFPDYKLSVKGNHDTIHIDIDALFGTFSEEITDNFPHYTLENVGYKMHTISLFHLKGVLD